MCKLILIYLFIFLVGGGGREATLEIFANIPRTLNGAGGGVSRVLGLGTLDRLSARLGRLIPSHFPMLMSVTGGGTRGYPAIRGGAHHGAHGSNYSTQAGGLSSVSGGALRGIKGKYLLDQESMSTLLMLLFVPDNTVALSRLHRLVRNVCYHAQTRQWVIQSLLQIVDRAKLSADSEPKVLSALKSGKESEEEVMTK
jgi:hypothetical protein